MRKVSLIPSLLLLILISSCQKEIDWNQGNNSSDGDLLIRAVQVTPATSDTNIITFQWDANKRLIQYRSNGKVNSIQTDILHRISRKADGKVDQIVSKTSLTAGFIDSVIYKFYYNGTKLEYVIDTQFTIIGELRDSSAFAYNAGGRISVKDTYMDIIGTLTHTTRETFTYDANGNLLADSVFTPDGSGGFDLGSVAKNTYTTHKCMAQLGDESYMVISAENVSPNTPNIKVVDATAGGGTTYTSTFTQFQYNSFDRPVQANLSVTPKPPGYDMKLTFFYQ